LTGIALGHSEDGLRIGAIHANDDLGWSFEAIADALETQYLNREESD
jgi:hypothetical protein